VTESTRSNYDRITTGAAFAIMILSFVLSWVTARCMLPGHGKVVFTSLAVMLSALWTFKRFTSVAAVSIILGAALVAHIAAIAFFPWVDNQYAGVLLIPVGLADYSIIYLLCVRAIG
jgi:hypothetical protein